MASAVDIDVTWPARWLRLIWWFPYRYLIFFFAIPGLFLLTTSLPQLLGASSAAPAYWTIIQATTPAVVVGTIAFPLLGWIGVHLTGKMNRHALAIAVPLLLAASVPYYSSAPGLLAEMARGSMLPYVYFKVLAMVAGPVLVIAALRLMWVCYRHDGRVWRLFGNERIFLTRAGAVTWRKVRVGLLTAVALAVAFGVFQVLRTLGDGLLKRLLAPSLHKGADNFVWYATTEPAVSEGYAKLLLSSPGARTFFFANLFWWAIAAAIAVIIFRVALRSIRRYNAKIWSDDPRPPILLLRSFSDDAASVWPTAVFRQLTGRRYRLEEAIADELDDLGPVVAVGQPGEWLPPLGAWREELADDEWQSRVIDLMDRSQLILLIAGITHWVRWELDQVLARGHGDKLIICFPNSAPAARSERLRVVEDGWREAAGQPLVLPEKLGNLRLMHFLPDGDVVYVSSSGAKQSDYQLAGRIATIQKHQAGVPIGRVAGDDGTNTRATIGPVGRATVWGLAWFLTFAILGMAFLQPDLRQLQAKTCKSLAAAPWDPISPGKVEFQQLDHRLAVAVCHATLAEVPENLATRFQLGRALEAAGRLGEARRHYEIAAAASYGAALNSLGLLTLDDTTRPEAVRQREALRLFDGAIERGVTIALLGRVRVYAGNTDLDPSGRRAAGNFLIAVGVGVYQARAQLVGGLSPFGFDGRVIRATEQILADLGVFPETPDEKFTFESLQAGAVLFTDETKVEPERECLSVGKTRQCFRLQ